jgi:ubiquinone/menaquinone biosynthesis C-methylase UbiE
VQAEGAVLPFRAESFDFISCQFAFHHLPDKTRMLREVFSMLRQGGRFVIRNCAHMSTQTGSITNISRRRRP